MDELTTPITAGQIEKMEALKRLLRIDDEFWKNRLLKAWGADSLEELTAIEAGMSIFELEAKAIQFGVLIDPAVSRKHEKETSLTPILTTLKRMKKRKLERLKSDQMHTVEGRERR